MSANPKQTMTQTMANSFTSNGSAAPSSTSNRDSESIHGCEHVQHLAVANQQDFNKITEAYSKICKELKSGGPDLGLTWHCLECSHAGEAKDRDSHTEETGHRYSTESSSMCVFCRECNDFVYDSALECVRKYGVPEPASKKRKIQDEEDDESFLRSNSTKRLCSATSIRGLYNLGQTCYQNAIVQSLLHSPLLTSYFLRDGHQAHSCKLSNCLGCATSEVFAECHNAEKNEGYAAAGLLLATWRTSTQLTGYRQEDAHEFFQFLVDSLHESTVDGKKVNGRTCRCFFHKAFYGTLRSKVTCNKCGNSTIRDDQMLDLSLDMKIQAKKKALETSKSSANLDLEGCLRAYTAAEKLPSNDYTCQICDGTPQQATKTLKVRKLPAILCMQLKRFEHSTSAEKVEGKLDFPMEINMQPYTTKPRSHRVSNYLYDLQSAIIHKGTISSGHYVAYCRQETQWFLFDDDKITLATEADVLNADAYLLFYSLRSLVPPRRKGQETVPVED